MPRKFHCPTAEELPPISETTFFIGGITITVHGLSQLPPSTSITSLSVLFLLHPRLENASYTTPIAQRTLAAHYSTAVSKTHGLLTVGFDQRNHGNRMVHPLANEAWRQNNPRHALDMFSVYHGTSLDVSMLIDYLPVYLFPTGDYHITKYMCSGVSLGGHATWLCLLHEPRITAGVIVIGCADYQSVMIHRAEKSKLSTWTGKSENFLGSKDYPTTLMDVVNKVDPSGVLLRSSISEDEKRRKLGDKFAGKKILSLSGGADKLVPYECCKPFMDWIKMEKPIKDGREVEKIDVKEIVYDGIGHSCTEAMVAELVKFVVDVVKAEDGAVEAKI